VISVLILIGAAVSGCGRGSSATEKIDETKTQLYVAIFEGGTGDAWLKTLKAKFERAYADVSFENGKLGAQIIIDSSKNAGRTVLDYIAGDSNDVYFNEGISLNTFASQKYVLPLDDICDEPLSDGKTIRSKLSSDQITNLTALDGHIYGIPHYECYGGVNYDKDLFSSKRLYFAYDAENNGGEANEFIKKSSDARSCGPDGARGTEDDGLPSSLEEFYLLMEKMVEMSIVPFVWTGKTSTYTEYLLNAFYANWMGYEEFSENFTFSGNTEIISKATATTNGYTFETDRIDIQESNGYMLTKQTGRYYALELLHKIMTNPAYYYSKSTQITFSHLDAQEAFVYSRLDTKMQPIAMLIDGSWWENEASDPIARTIKAYGSDAENRNFGFMPLPVRVGGSVAEGGGKALTLFDHMGSYVIINANTKNTPKETLAKQFVKYAYTDENLQMFTTTSGTAKAVAYDLTAEQVSSLSPYSRSVWNLRNNPSVNIASANSPNEMFINEEVALKLAWSSVIRNQNYLSPYSAFRDSKTAYDVFGGIYELTLSGWSDYGEYFKA
jgi:ABC-type glycerol-3-phosphate transport system substrate-binding protein